jgi:hypothetical protein
MSMTKYGDSSDVVATLLKMKLCETEEEAMEKVASGEAGLLIKDFKMKLFSDMTKLYDENLDEVSPTLTAEFEKIKKELEEE